MAAFRYVALNPVKAKRVKAATDWRWSSTRAHWVGRDDALVKVKPLPDRIEAVLQFLDDAADPAVEHALAKGQTVPIAERRRACVVGEATEPSPAARAAGSPKKAGNGKCGRWIFG